MNQGEGWKTLLERHDDLRDKAVTTLYDRVTLLGQVFKDEDYLKAMKEEGKSPVELLDCRVTDTCANFTELLRILEMFPRREQWEKGNLANMRSEMIRKVMAESRSKRRNGGGQDNTSDSPNKDDADRETKLSWKQKFLALRRDYELLQARYEQLEANYKQLQKQLGPKPKRAAAAK